MAVVLVIVVIIVVAGVAGYFYYVAPGTTSTSTSAKYGSPITIGMTLSESGTYASLDGNYTKFNTAWVNYVNGAGGLVDKDGLHHNVTIIWYDDQSQTNLAVSDYHELAEQNNATVLISPYSADIGTELIPIAQADQVPIIMAEASTASMWVPSNPHSWAVTSMVPYWSDNTTTGWSGSYFAMLKAQIAANPSTAPKTIAFVGWDITWAKDDYNSSIQLAKQAGLQVVYQNLLEPNSADPVSGFSAIIPQLQAANPDIVYLATFGPVAALWMKAAASAGYAPKQWHTIEWGSAFTGILTGNPTYISHTTTDVFWTPTYLSKSGGGYVDETLFSNLLTTAYGSAQAGWYLFQNIELRMIIFEMIAAAVAQTTSPTRANLNAALHSLNIPTIAGQLVIQPQGYGNIGLVTVQWQNDRVQTVYPSTLANATYAWP
jgi:ABC-type branched-subunit amino acid transport system substrate-binding protein